MTCFDAKGRLHKPAFFVLLALAFPAIFR